MNDDPEGAVETQRRAVALVEKLHGKDHWRVALEMGQLAENIFTSGREREACETWQEARRVLESSPVEAPFASSVSLMRAVPECLGLAGQVEEALPLAEQSLAFAKESLGPDTPYRYQSLLLLAVLHMQKGEVNTARSYWLAAIETHPGEYGRQSVRIPRSLVVLNLIRLAELVGQAGESEDSLRLYQMADELMQKSALRGVGSAEADFLDQYAAFLRSIGHDTEAAEQEERAEESRRKQREGKLQREPS